MAFDPEFTITIKHPVEQDEIEADVSVHGQWRRATLWEPSEEPEVSILRVLRWDEDGNETDITAVVSSPNDAVAKKMIELIEEAALECAADKAARDEYEQECYR